mmetsp:Transcript_47486/g.76197  ORF Transcript_47486/g.76197 Transcript_47486/m.76197 type:complete len:92 (-) Transcript_47486:82-357(-)
MMFPTLFRNCFSRSLGTMHGLQQTKTMSLRLSPAKCNLAMKVFSIGAVMSNAKCLRAVFLFNEEYNNYQICVLVMIQMNKLVCVHNIRLSI